jgi:hypothetical protein
MKTIRKLIALIVALAAVSAAVIALAEDYGSGAVSGGQTYTIEQMLTYALQDETLASAEYRSLIEKFEAARPFDNILRAEETHIELLLPLFTQYGVTTPANTAADRVALPDTIEEVYASGVQAEVNNIAMYDAFLAQELPDDVRVVFEALRNASESHLNAFEQNAERQAAAPQSTPGAGLGLANGNGNGYRNSGAAQDPACVEDGVPAGSGLGNGNRSGVGSGADGNRNGSGGNGNGGNGNGGKGKNGN